MSIGLEHADDIIADLEENVLPGIREKYGLTTGYDGQQRNQRNHQE